MATKTVDFTKVNRTKQINARIDPETAAQLAAVVDRVRAATGTRFSVADWLELMAWTTNADSLIHVVETAVTLARHLQPPAIFPTTAVDRFANHND